ncbi:MAG: CDP-glucose 4,6-dehydratase [Cohaesibacter sp.]|nr:CDP-glucose 4,6-dehydratase [Cohaesibacter sp.]MCV6602068.1 CDP-glucose 4,6-dehydratase [Cohaesibacter sp.]
MTAKVYKVPDPHFWRGKRVLLTGHTGFKGAWCALWLHALGAKVTAFALPPEGAHSLYQIAGIETICDSHFIDLRDTEAVKAVVSDTKPQIVLHMAAQALVRRSIKDPVTTWQTNVDGTLNLLQALKKPDIQEGLDAILAITTDKVYANDGQGQVFVEGDALGGKDPYSASKAACEILVASHAKSYFATTPMATARGGNVIGGGDFSQDRLAPDCVRAVCATEPVVLRQPNATRPWQHVLDCLCGYLLYLENLAQDEQVPRALNIGPDSAHDLPVVDFAKQLLSEMGRPDLLQINEEKNSIEAAKLALNPARAQRVLGWRDHLVGKEAIVASAKWYQSWAQGADMGLLTRKEIYAYQGLELN